jgi:hypothetical protein
MANDIKTALADPNNSAAFAMGFLDGYLTPAFGARSKSETDLLVFGCLVTAKAIDPEGPIYDIARALNITPTRARGLVMNWELRTMSSQEDLRKALVGVLQHTRFSKDGTYLTFGVESPLVREEIVARLKRKGVFPDASFARELVRLPVEAFVDFLDDILDPKVKAAVKKTLITDKQLPDRSFKALATGVLMKLGEKVAGKAGEVVAGAIGDAVFKPVAETVTGFLSDLLKGNAQGAASQVSTIDHRLGQGLSGVRTPRPRTLRACCSSAFRGTRSTRRKGSGP